MLIPPSLEISESAFPDDPYQEVRRCFKSEDAHIGGMTRDFLSSGVGPETLVRVAVAFLNIFSNHA
jgi:hypothetical protein